MRKTAVSSADLCNFRTCRVDLAIRGKAVRFHRRSTAALQHPEAHEQVSDEDAALAAAAGQLERMEGDLESDPAGVHS